MVVSLPGGCFGRWAIGSWQPFQIPVQAICLLSSTALWCSSLQTKAYLNLSFLKTLGWNQVELLHFPWVLIMLCFPNFGRQVFLEFSEPLGLLISDSPTPASSSTAVHAFTDSLGNPLWVFVGVTKWWLVRISQFWIIAGSQICLFQSSCQLRMKNEIMILPLKQEIAKIDHYRNPYHSTSTSWTMKSVRQHSVLNVSLVVSSFLKTSIQSCGSRISGLCPAITHYVARLHPVRLGYT